MKVITETHYQANDGRTFNTQEECKLYEDCLKWQERQSRIYELSMSVRASGVTDGLSEFIVNNYDKIKEIMEGKTEAKPTVSTEVNWSKVPAGTIILVRDFNDAEWVEYVFIVYKENDDYPYRCAYGERGTVYPISWKFAKLKT